MFLLSQKLSYDLSFQPYCISQTPMCHAQCVVCKRNWIMSLPLKNPLFICCFGFNFFCFCDYRFPLYTHTKHAYTCMCAHTHTLRLLHTKLHHSRDLLLVFVEVLSYIINFQHYNSVLKQRGCLMPLRRIMVSCHTAHKFIILFLIQVIACLQEDK